MRVKLWSFLFVLILLSVIISASVLADQYAYTEAYFFIPSDVSFTVEMPGDGDLPYTSGDTYPGLKTTAWLSFNTSTWPVTDIEPWTLGVDDVAHRQNGLTEPIFRVTNAGNIPIDFYIQIDSLDACLSVCAISECGYGTGNCGGALGFVGTCTDIQAAELQVVNELPDTDGQDLLFIALYGSFGAGCFPQEYGPYNIYHRSTAD